MVSSGSIASRRGYAALASDFGRIGAELDEAGLSSCGRVGSARSRLLRQREVVDFAIGWMERERAG